MRINYETKKNGKSKAKMFLNNERNGKNSRNLFDMNIVFVLNLHLKFIMYLYLHFFISRFLYLNKDFKFFIFFRFLFQMYSELVFSFATNVVVFNFTGSVCRLGIVLTIFSFKNTRNKNIISTFVFDLMAFQKYYLSCYVIIKWYSLYRG